MHRMSVVSAKRERELARAKYARQKAKRATRKHRVKLLTVTSLALAVIGLAMYWLIPRSNVEEIASPTSEPTIPSVVSVQGCEQASTPRTNNITFPAPPNELVPAQSISLSTNCGEIVIASDPNAPNTVGIMSFLASSKFYDGVSCHRLTTEGIFVLQCGDPAGNGSGGPGFEFADENLPVADQSGIVIYPRGTVAMANRGPGTNGSQFFLVYKDSPLPPNYPIWGQLTAGLDRIEAIAAAGTLTGSTDGPPAQPLVINNAVITP